MSSARALSSDPHDKPQRIYGEGVTAIFCHWEILRLFFHSAQISNQVKLPSCRASQAHSGTFIERRGSVGGKYRLTGIFGDACVVDEIIAWCGTPSVALQSVQQSF